MLLTVGIITIAERKDLLQRMLDHLRPQLNDETELIVNNGPGKMGTKRNQICDLASGQYIVHCDDDDIVAPWYISEILRSIKAYDFPDAVDIDDFICNMKSGKKQPRECYFIHKEWGCRYEGDLKVHQRPLSQTNPIKLDIARQVRYEDRNAGEDQAYSQALIESNLVKRSAPSPGILYFYKWIPNKIMTK